MWAQEDRQPGCVWGRGPCKLSCPQRAAHQLRSGLAQGRPPVETSYGPRGCSGRGPGLPAVTKEKVCNGDCRPRGCAEGSCRDDRTHGAGPLQLGGAQGLGERALNLMKFTCKIEIGGVASLVAQRCRIRLPVQETQVRSLVREDLTYWGCRSCRGCALEPGSRDYKTRLPEPVPCSKGSRCGEKPACCDGRSPCSPC